MAALLEARPFRPFKSSEEYLYAMKEDLAEWFQILYPELCINVDNFLDRLETGVALCKHANAVKKYAGEYIVKRQARKVMTRSVTGALALPLAELADVRCFQSARPGTFFARDNVSNFIQWCRSSLKIFECLLFETDDLILRKNEKHVILCLLEVARKGAKFGMLAPMLVQMERQIDREIAADQRRQDGYGLGNDNGNNDADDSDSELEEEEPVLMYGPTPQIVTNDLKSLDEMVRDLVEKCTCPTQFPMIRVSEGKYRIGDTKVLIFVRILRNHVMVRVGGGWDTLSHYLDKHDPCRCRAQHRTTQSARLVRSGAPDLAGARVYYDRSPPRTPQAQSQQPIYTNGQQKDYLGPPMNSLNRSRSRSPSYSKQHHDSRRSASPNMSRRAHNQHNQHHQQQQQPSAANHLHSLALPRPRSRSPSPHYVSSTHTKLKTPVPERKPQVARSVSPSPAACRTRGTTPPTSLSPVHSSKFANAKNPSNHVATMQIAAQDSPKLTLVSEASLNIGGDAGATTDHSDNASEVSDEGYRSLGLIQDKGRNKRSSLHSQNSVEDVEENEHPEDAVDYAKSTEYPADAEEERCNDTGLRRTNFSQIYDESNGGGGGAGGTARPANTRASPSPSRAYKITKSSSLDKPPAAIRSRSNSLDKTSQMLLQHQAEMMMTPVSRRNSKNHAFAMQLAAQAAAANTTGVGMKKSNSKPNVSTWSGRPAKQRSSLSADTFSPPSFQRNAPTRASARTSYDQNGRRLMQSANSSPTNKSPLKQQIVKTLETTADDGQMLEKIKQLLDQYGTLNGNDPAADPEDLLLQEGGDGDAAGKLGQLAVFTSPRKDSKPDNIITRIPAPVSSHLKTSAVINSC